jgi:L-fuconolactonase
MPIDALPAMQSCGIEAAIAVQARTTAAETEFLLGLAARNPHIVGVVGWADLQSQGLEEQLDRWTEQPALRGLRHVLQDEPDIATLIGSPAFNHGVSILQKRQLVYEVLVFDHQLAAVVDFCARHDRHWLVLDHLGKPAVREWFKDAEVPRRWAARVRELAAMPHVMCKLSGLVTETHWQTLGLRTMDTHVIHACFDQALQAFGPRRLLFGSDWPVCEVAAPYGSVHHIAQTWATSRLAAQEQEAFWGGNAMQCYGLPVPALNP